MVIALVEAPLKKLDRMCECGTRDRGIRVRREDTIGDTSADRNSQKNVEVEWSEWWRKRRESKKICYG